MSLLVSFYIFMTALFSSLIMVPFLRKWAIGQGNVDIPDARKVHDTPTPRLGGVAIFLAFLFSVLAFVPMEPAVRGMLFGGLVMFATGLVDDLYEISAKRKFIGEIAACLAAIVIGQLWLSNLGNLFGFGDIILPTWVGIPFTVFAVVGVINAINLIDGLDGLAGGFSSIALSAFLLMGILVGDMTTVMLSAALFGALLGFLKYNFYPARIFMGDVGSLTVGFLLGFLAVHLTQHAGSSASPVVPLIILGLPILDTIRVMTGRIRRRLSPFSPDKNHVHHQFLALGFAHRFTVLILYTLTLFLACFAVLFHSWPEYLMLIFFLIFMVAGYQGLRYVSTHPERFAFLQRDSDTSLRNSRFYLQTAEQIDRLVPVISVLLLVYFALAVTSLFDQSIVPWQVLVGLLFGGLVLFFRSASHAQEEFLLLVVFSVGFIAAFQVWSFTDPVLLGLSIKRYGDILLAVIACLVVLKLVIHKPGEIYLSTPDYLALGLCVFFAIASGKSVINLNLGGPLARAVIVMVALRTVISHRPANHRYAVWGSLGLLLLALIIGLVGG